jgi:hypothetical protein
LCWYWYKLKCKYKIELRNYSYMVSSIIEAISIVYIYSIN